jgi:hypothetical protein
MRSPKCRCEYSESELVVVWETVSVGVCVPSSVTLRGSAQLIDAS